MQIIYVNYGTYKMSSGVHIHFLGNELTKMGHDVTSVIPYIEDNEHFGHPNYEIIDYITFGKYIAEGKYSENTIVHGWTPRENVRQVVKLAADTLKCKYFVHLEDNERRLLEAMFKQPFKQICMLASRGEINVPEAMSHPLLHQTFIAEANGVSILMDKLGEFVPNDVPTQLIWPACEEEFYKLPVNRNMKLRETFKIPENATVIVYPGNVHYANADIVAPLYRALPLIEQKGHPIHLVRCAGSDHGFIPKDIYEIIEKYITAFPMSQPSQLPAFLRIADILVQPGSENTFDDYRFPSKLPLFLASGRPVILAKTNIGRFLEDEINCRILKENTPENIAELVIELIENKDKAAKIGNGGREFAKEHFNWIKSATRLVKFYQTCPQKPQES